MNDWIRTAEELPEEPPDRFIYLLKDPDAAADIATAFGGLKSYLLSLAKKADDALHGDNVVRDTRITCQQVVSIAKAYGYKPIEDVSDD